MRAFPWVIWALMLAADLSLVAGYGNNVPFQDDWTLVPVLTGCQDVTPAWVWYQHNEHRLPLAKLAIVGLGRVSGNNFRALMFVNVCLLAAAAALLIWATPTTKRSWPWTDAFYPLVLLHWGHADNFLWAWQIGFTSAVLVVLSWLAFMIRARGNSPQPEWALAIVAVLLPLCGGVGMCFLPFLVIWLACRAFTGKTATERYWSAAGASAGLVLGALYFRGYTIEHSPLTSTNTEVFEATVQFFSLGLGMPGSVGWRVVGTAMLSGFALGMTLLLTSLWQSPALRTIFGAQFCFFGGFLLLAGAIAWSRAGIGTGAAMAGRYVTLAAMGACWLYAVVVLDDRRIAHRYLPIVLVVLAASMLGPNTLAGYRHALSRRQVYDAFKTDMAAGTPPVVLAAKYNTAPQAIGFSYLIRRFPGWLVMMHDSGHPEFQRLNSVLPTRTISVTAAHEIFEGKRRFVLPGQMFVYAVRLRNTMPKPAQVDLQCGPAAVHRLTAVEARTFQMAPPKSILLWWVNQQTSGFDLTTIATSVGANDIEALVPN